MSHERDIRRGHRSKRPRNRISRLPRSQTRIAPYSVTKEIRLALLCIIPEGIWSLEAGAVLDAATGRRPVPKESVLTDFDDRACSVTVHVEADEGVLVDGEEGEVDRGGGFQVDVGLWLAEGLEVAGVCVAKDRGCSWISLVIGIIFRVLYFISHGTQDILGGFTNCDAQ